MKKGLAQEGSQAPCTKWAWALLAAVLLFIWGNSLLPPSWSWRVSGVVQEAVEQVRPASEPKSSDSAAISTSSPP